MCMFSPAALLCEEISILLVAVVSDPLLFSQDLIISSNTDFYRCSSVHTSLDFQLLFQKHAFFPSEPNFSHIPY